ncbi:hypothetical protein [Photobacterium swingsii]|nr:hypothetical protein [Photobacterium swingsii]
MKNCNELLIRRLMKEAHSYLDKMESLLSSVDNRLAEDAKKAA